MSTNGRRVAQKTIAIILIVAILDVIGFELPMILLFVMAGFFVWVVFLRSTKHRSEDFFDFYIQADEILRDRERHWYGFEIAEVIGEGKLILQLLPDAPPLTSFVMGALHHRAGDYDTAIEYLKPLIEGNLIEENLRGEPSPELRRYVENLRRIERDPSVAPEVLAAVRNLERMRRRAPSLLAECRNRSQWKDQIEPTTVAENVVAESRPEGIVKQHPDDASSAFSAPPSITEVLRDVYDLEKTA